MKHKVSMAVFTSRAEKWVGEGREEDTIDVICEVKKEQFSPS